MKNAGKGIKDSFAWSCLELLIVPIILAGLGFYLDESIKSERG
jgi:hypothetical protein